MELTFWWGKQTMNNRYNKLYSMCKRLGMLWKRKNRVREIGSSMGKGIREMSF